MKLFLCEKPSQGQDIGKILGTSRRNDGYLTNSDNSICVTWGFGHLVEQYQPEDYDPAYKKWTFETLPIIPKQWAVAAKKESKKQYNTVIKLLKQAKSLVIATDADREGEMIARELVDLANFRGHIQRLWLSALDEASIRKALSSLKDNQETLPLYYAGLGRSRADWLIGMNFSRLFTLLAQQKGYQGPPLSVGRVQSPTLAMVVNRDKEIANFVPLSHYALAVHFNAHGRSFIANWLPPEHNCDNEGRCLNIGIAQQAEQQIRQAVTANVVNIDTTHEKVSPPLLFSLSDLQSECNRLYGMGAQQVLDIAQSLYEVHKITTYPRTDCGYLPETQFTEVNQVINAIINIDSRLQSLRSHLNLQQKSRAWNTQKVTAHHGIIPTMAKGDLTKLNPDELKVYDLIRRRYLAQFLPHFETDKTTITLTAANHSLIAKGRIITAIGWKMLFSKAGDEAEVNEEDKQQLPPVQINQRCHIQNTEVKSLKTTPPNHYTEGTLLTAMKNAARFVTEEELKKRLRETEGLGTEATRAGIIETLLKKGFIKKKGKSLIATPEAYTLIDNLPDLLKNPGLTALWEQALNQIAERTLSLDEFMLKQEKFVQMLMARCLKQGINMGNIKIKKCPLCQAPMVKRTGKNGAFWGCSNYPKCHGIENVNSSKIACKKTKSVYSPLC